MKKVWKPVKGYENHYEVSNYGEVRSIEKTIKKANGQVQRRKSRILKPILKDGYHRVVLYKNNKLKRFYLHQLVASHFLENPNNYREVNHKDGDKLNCHVNNLEWMSRSENVKHMWDTGLRV